MDPEACLTRAEEALADGDLEECQAALDDYRDWRSRGGFQPADGDDRAAGIRERLSRRLAGQD